MICLGISVVGLAIRVIAVGHAPANTSGRNTASQLADQLNTTGIYATVRHPLYLGNYLIGLGVVMSPCAVWLPVVYSLSFWIYYERIMMAEEGFLRSRFGSSFTEWAERTPPFLPRLSHWIKPAESFSLRSVLRREYTGLALMILMHCSVVEVQYIFADGKFLVAPFWTSLLAFGIVSYLLLRQLKVHTKVLDVPGR